MKKLIREIPLTNGLTVRFFDTTRRYFGDYHQVRINICCEVPLSAEFFEDEAAHRDAAKLLGGSVSYSKDIEHQGVATNDIEATVEKVIQHFVDHSLSYLSGAEFPRKLVQSELKRILGKRKAFVVGGYRG